MKYTFVYIILLWCFYPSFSQEYRCGFLDECKKMGMEESDFLMFNENSNLVSDYNLEIGLRNEITIPLVFHIFNRVGKPKKVTVSDVYNQLDRLNEAFSGSNYDLSRVPDKFRHLIGKSIIKFCIAQMKVGEKTEKGIILDETDIDYFGDQLLESDVRRRKIKHSSEGGSNQWDSDKYVNVWVGEMEKFNGTSTFPGISEELKNEEGIVLDPDQLNPDKKGKVLVHELGHYFSLLHIWGNQDNECEEDDGVDDTPPQIGPYFGCPADTQYSCGSEDMFVNYMDYTDQNCSLMFTAEQTTRIEKSIFEFRPQLTASNDLCFSTVADENFLHDLDIYADKDHIVILTENLDHEKIYFSVYNIAGKKVYESVINPGQSSYEIRKNTFVSGVYIFSLTCDKLKGFRKLAIFDF